MIVLHLYVTRDTKMNLQQPGRPSQFSHSITGAVLSLDFDTRLIAPKCLCCLHSLSSAPCRSLSEKQLALGGYSTE